ncbi:tyrosine-type recombinase/integrase [Pseudonocardia sp. GCM10023141]|uniref:tyrosine-type recombinase/integrase n=1 Tax=Pseudonocardia sp. GCM10023141 TaxID=3252653 RepID=UPI003615FF36
MLLIDFSSRGWESWGVERQPLIREGMPVLVDDDLRFEDGPGNPRATVVVNRWLRELPVNGAPARRTWRVYAEALRAWLEFLSERGVAPFGSRQELRAVLSAYAGHRLSESPQHRWDGSTWNLHVTALSRFYEWAQAERYATAGPLSYSSGTRIAEGTVWTQRRNHAKLRPAKRHAQIKYLEHDFAALLLHALAGLTPEGGPDEAYRGRALGRNAAVGRLALASGLRRQELTYLLVYEIPPLPARRSAVPVEFPLGRGTTKGSKPRTTWIDYDSLVEVWDYVRLERTAAARRGGWQPPAQLGEPLRVRDPDWEGARINGVRRSWRTLTPNERLRLVSPDGAACLLALQSTGAPFTDWATVLRRTSQRIRRRFEPRFPIVSPHRLRHTFAMHTLERLIRGYYQQAAALVKDTDADAALALYLTMSDPMAVLRDLLGHSSVTTTQLYLSRLDITRVYRDAYAAAAPDTALPDTSTFGDGVGAEFHAEFDAEFDGDFDDEASG